MVFSTAITFGMSPMRNGGIWSPFRGSPKFTAPSGSPRATAAGPATAAGGPSVARNLFGRAENENSNDNNNKPKE